MDAKKNIKNQSGSIIIFALLLMVVLSATAMTTAFIVIINVKATANSAKAAAAYYGAESGIELGLAKVKRDRDTETISFSTTEGDLNNYGEPPLDLDNEATFTTSVDESTTELVFNLDLGETKQINFYDIDTGDSVIGSAGSVSIEWPSSGTDIDTIEFAFKGFNPGDWENFSSEDYTFYTWFSGSETLPLDAAFSYVFKIKPLYSDIENITMSVSNSSGDVAFPNYLTIESEGNYGSSTIKLKADTVWKAPVSGLGEYVLFSEDQIVK